MKNKKPTLKERIYKWLCEHDYAVTPITDIKQTNITFRKTSYRNQYYFSYANWMSPYTMKRWIEIAENKEYDSYKTTHGDWYWIKDNKAIN
jgi:hypothetical protein